jgi:putative sigma-54 modulation protein
MNLQISGHHLDVTPALRGYMTHKLERVRRHFDKVIDVNALLTVDKLNQKAECTLNLPGCKIHAEAIDADLYAAIDELVDKLDRQVLRHKSKVRDHHHEAIKRQILA